MLASVSHAHGVTDHFNPDPYSMRRPERIYTTGLDTGNFDTGPR